MSPLPTIDQCIQVHQARGEVKFQTATIALTWISGEGTLMEDRGLIELRTPWQGLPPAVREGLERHLITLMAVSPDWGLQ